MRLLLAVIAALAVVGFCAAGLAQEGPGGPHASEAPSPRAARIHADLQEVLRTGGFEQEKPGEGILAKMGKWLTDLWNAFQDWLRRIFGFGGSVGSGSSTIMPYVLVIVLLVGVAYAIAFAVKNYRRAAGKSGRKPSVDIVAEPEESAAAEPDAWIAAARRHADAGDYRRAYRAVFLAILIRLDRRGAIRFERSKTNGDYIRALRGAPDLLAFLRPLANDFDARWYGHAEATKSDFDRALAQYESVPGASA